MASDDISIVDSLKRSRAALTMIQPEPFNAEAPPEALAGNITPTNLHYVRSNLALPVHDGVLSVDGAVGNPITLTLDDLRGVEQAVTMECAGNGRLAQAPLPTGEPWGKYALSTARWAGALLHHVLARSQPADSAVEVVFHGADHGRYHQYTDIGFARSLTYAHAADPAAEILIAYEMNGEPLNPDHGAPFRLVVPHWYGVASVKWLERVQVSTEPFSGELQTGHYMYEWPDRPHEQLPVMRPRACITAPAPRSTVPAAMYTVRGKAWSGTGPVSKVEVAFTGEGEWHLAKLAAPGGPVHVAGMVLRLGGERCRTSHPARPRHRRCREHPTRRARLEPARLRQQRRRSHLRRRSRLT
ncbi:MAG TPA: molybdopterin-dependent oxidoreductase [Jatrophihabitans sp.]|jgi:DMSO/TMAO reductase YedYZ molybdopterin-dependent catalytic subunit|nr:molybdopterin-dependent oxidoreductase [Jatrophihabitans sp.]